MRLLPRISRRRFVIGLGLFLALIAVALGGVALYVRHVLTASLPQLDGECRAEGLSAPVQIERDGLGVPTIRAANLNDALYGLGFAHAQDRFFQMDLARRFAAGELAELFGPEALNVDRGHRVHRFRARARRSLAKAAGPERSALDAYTRGVNAGLHSLKTKPWEYHLLGGEPQPWLPEDCLLVVQAMYLRLQSDNPEREATRAVVYHALPKPVADWLTAPGSEWDAPLEGGPLPTPPVPTAKEYDLRTLLAGPLRAVPPDQTSLAAIEGGVAGSNNWAVAGTHTAHGGALLANDMHLGLSLPNTWYRARLVWHAADGERWACGATLPGGPAVAVGSNGHVAWGFTNTQGDWADLINLDIDPADANRYRTPSGFQPFETFHEEIAVKGQAPNVLEVRETIWGPVFDTDWDSRPRALRWVAHDPEGVNLAIIDLLSANTLEEALNVANRCGAPHQNFLVADAQGDIAWTVLGRLPRRVGFDGRLPVSWADGQCRWDGYRPPKETPRIVRPAEGRLWTANNRVVNGEALQKLGFGGYDRGVRAGRIRDELRRLNKATEADMLRLQLDDRNVLFDRWHDLLRNQVLTPQAIAENAPRAELRRLLEPWNGRATIDSVAYRLVFEYRRRVIRAVLMTLTTACRKADPQFRLALLKLERPVWELIQAKPLHLLDPRRPSWDEFLRLHADELFADLHKLGPDLSARTWGELNVCRIRHPFSRAFPSLGRWLDIPPQALPGGWTDTPRIQGVAFGASERMAVSPGKEALGYFHMPGGQSGHPLSPHYRDGQAAWAEGLPTPFLPGEPVHVLTLRPAP